VTAAAATVRPPWIVRITMIGVPNRVVAWGFYAFFLLLLFGSVAAAVATRLGWSPPLPIETSLYPEVASTQSYARARLRASSRIAERRQHESGDLLLQRNQHAHAPVITLHPSITPTTVLAMAVTTRTDIAQCRLFAIARPARPLTSSDTTLIPPTVPTPNASR